MGGLGGFGSNSSFDLIAVLAKRFWRSCCCGSIADGRAVAVAFVRKRVRRLAAASKEEVRREAMVVSFWLLSFWLLSVENIRSLLDA
jgi:hypothetical protein